VLSNPFQPENDWKPKYLCQRRNVRAFDLPVPALLESRLYVVSFVTAFEKMLRNWTAKLLFANCNFCFASSFTVENKELIAVYKHRCLLANRCRCLVARTVPQMLLWPLTMCIIKCNTLIVIMLCILNPLMPTVAIWIQLWSILSFVIFDIRALWRSGLSVRVPGCQKLQMTA